MPQLDFNLFFNNFFWLVVNLVFVYIFFLAYLLPKLLKVLTLRKFVLNYFNLLFLSNKIVLKNLNFLSSKKFFNLMQNLR